MQNCDVIKIPFVCIEFDWAKWNEIVSSYIKVDCDYANDATHFRYASLTHHSNRWAAEWAIMAFNNNLMHSHIYGFEGLRCIAFFIRWSPDVILILHSHSQPFAVSTPLILQTNVTTNVDVDAVLSSHLSSMLLLLLLLIIRFVVRRYDC